MQMLSTKTKTATETKKLQSRRNLFGLGVTSLIAACSGAAADGAGGSEPENGMTVTPTATLPFEAVKAPELSGTSGFTPTISGTTSLVVTVEKPEGTDPDTAILTFNGATANDTTLPNRAGIYKLTTTENQYDLVISASSFDSQAGSHGRIFIYWNVANVTTGSSPDLQIKGAMRIDNIGIGTTEFLQLGGSAGETKYDMVIRSYNVNKSGNNHEGAIYILWDVEDYYGEINPNNKTIDLGAVNNSGGFHATSGLLTIYGAAAQANLGENDDKNILYKTVDGNKTLTNIDGDKKIDIAITDGMYTYVFFGNQIAATGNDTKVASKTIDLAAVNGIALFTEGYFKCDFDNNGMGENYAAGDETNGVGYRFANANHTTLEAVESNFPKSTGLSDADGDLGVWDIA